MRAWLTVQIRKIQFRQLPSHCDSSTCFNFTRGRFGDHIWGQDGEFSKPFFITAGFANPYLFWVGEFVEGGIEGRGGRHDGFMELLVDGARLGKSNIRHSSRY